MTPVFLTALGWCAAALLGGLLLRARRRLVLVARAGHEVRGPLCAARLGLGTLAAEPGRVAAIDLELARAGRALDDLAAAPSGTRRPDRPELVDVTALARAYVPAWTTLARAHGAELRLETAEPTPPLPPAAAAPAPRRRHLRTVPALGEPIDAPAPRWRTDGPPPPLTTAWSLAPPAPRCSCEVVTLPAPRASAATGAPNEVVAVPAPWPFERAAAGSSRRPATPRPMPLAPPPATVLADPFRLAQAITNLVANAAEHGGGTVRVRVGSTGEHVRVEVADDGPGLPAPVRELAARSGDRRRGHGLAIALGIAERLGGRLAAMPASAGARLVLELPAAR
ncbi:sensor histidine kinase [Candidatus Solirubrobacter pratensis]|uniref:sensor histidine kinase n=1 Tax=Candidatus Solirubrobacter pratensis TaxID=1298857 RepID=UPI0004803756|nr:ATP-binding protein [Candidatus Solirubrobacter pratensis]